LSAGKGSAKKPRVVVTAGLGKQFAASSRTTWRKLMTKSQVVKKYRRAAKKLFKANKAEVEHYIMHPDDDTGQNAPGAHAIIYLERYGTFKEDKFTIPDALDFYGRNGPDNCFSLSEEAGFGFIEYINAAVAAVYE